MNAPYFVELLSGNGEVRSRHRQDSLPIRIGRGYDNDVILDDPFVAAHHALVDLTAEGGLVVKDLGSHNGIIYRDSRRTEAEIDGDSIFFIGQSYLRVRGADYTVAGEMKDTVSHKWEGWRPALAGLAIIVTLSVLKTWITDINKFEAIRYLSTVAIMLIIGMLWCGMWSFANRLFSGNARLGRHLFILACGIAALEGWSLISTSAAYAFSLETLTRYSSHIAIAIFAAMIFFHLMTVNPLRSRHFALLSIAIALICSGLMLMYNYSSRGLLADELYMSQRYPPFVRLSPDRQVSQLIGNAAALKTLADRERTKSPVTDEMDTEDND